MKKKLHEAPEEVVGQTLRSFASRKYTEIAQDIEQAMAKRKAPPLTQEEIDRAGRKIGFVSGHQL